ncbi:MAG: ABC transporter ATP-binding protein [Candidatus Thalassarchaeaceae archaeon]|jgi:ATP-binding cassette subfamily B protein|nr:ABC transporter ATP-binding protein [Candidatus Thalassarchaeaceae archaeon]MDP7092058.1 ABC transporter ATP-binding protein [Candidatus Thalassarchaeaceae archaeon]MDP7256790.1 ABC transporter ATP-binding protein [Candidatus Thalassarchaeaceae archaeon]MDP7446030.1 ABC transporter ATP-binding protein [Candidatus Thalassarchaeaceae archaeon]MDP7649528.1 ABC transporter ATP-binding protein [Candidatus Thalassarchaeaceae archaeon]|tara:strand:+ start:1371 stop:3254 length:1884 start_codon:yes stop_codon:yes gene_type:complete
MRSQVGGDLSISKDASDLKDEKQVVGRKIWRIVPYIKRYWKRAVGGVLANAAARAFDLIPFIAIGMAADYYRDKVYTSPAMESLVNSDILPSVGPISSVEISFGLLIFLSFTFLAVFQGLSEYLWQSTAYKVQHDIRMEATTSLMAMEASYFETRQTGNLMSVLSADVAQLEDIVSDSSTSIIRIVITFSTAFAIMIWMSAKLALILFIPLILIIPMVVWFSTRVQRRYRRQRESTGGIVAILENVLSGITVVQAYNASEFERSRVEGESGEYRDQAIHASNLRNRFLPGIYVVAGISFGLLVSAGGWLMESGEITVGQFVTFLLISTRMTMPMFILGMLLNQLQKGEAASKRVFALVDLEPSIFDKPDAVPLDGPIRSISFDNVTFAYPTSEANVLNGISFSVSSGEFLGVMGHTGAGKSTILKLVEKFYEPHLGSVKINGIEINAYTVESIRDRIGFVSQDPFLFYGSVRDNVAYARETSDDEIRRVLEIAGAWEFVSEMTDGLKTMVGDRGVMMSGGQRARIALARALLKDPDLLILDEASAALDAETERRIQQSLFSGSNGDEQRITIAVAHRLATIRNADEIIAMVDGAIVERGSHNKLLGNENVYASQWSIQTGDLGAAEV